MVVVLVRNGDSVKDGDRLRNDDSGEDEGDHCGYCVGLHVWASLWVSRLCPTYRQAGNGPETQSGKSEGRT